MVSSRTGAVTQAGILSSNALGIWTVTRASSGGAGPQDTQETPTDRFLGFECLPVLQSVPVYRYDVSRLPPGVFLPVRDVLYQYTVILCVYKAQTKEAHS